MTAVIQTESLSKTYGGGKRALDSLSLSVNEGEIFGFLGPNGAGKTTTIRLLLDFIRPSSGRAQVFGLDAQRDSLAVRAQIGYLPGELNLWDNLTAAQIIRYFGGLRGGYDENYVRALAERLQFDVTKNVRTYSTGNKRKLGLILALMNKPRLLILDEPTNGLDPLMQQTFHQLMREVRAEGRTVFLSSHILGEVQAICDRVGILRDGQLQRVERVETLTRASFRWVTLHFRDAVRAGALESVPGVSQVEQPDANSVRLQLSGDFDPLLRAIGTHYVQQMDVHEPSLEEIFLAFYGGASNGEAQPAVAEAGVR